jgi:hypothetical protein
MNFATFLIEGCLGSDFPGEAFRVLRKGEKDYGEYRTRRLVLEAWDSMEDSV